MADEVLTSTELEKLLNNLINNLDTDTFTKAALLSLRKTFHTHNITIQDWNTLIEYVNNNISNMDSICQIVKALGEHSILDIGKVEKVEQDLNNISDRLVLLSNNITNIQTSMLTVEAEDYVIPEGDR